LYHRMSLSVKSFGGRVLFGGGRLRRSVETAGVNRTLGHIDRSALAMCSIWVLIWGVVVVLIQKRWESDFTLFFSAAAVWRSPFTLPLNVCSLACNTVVNAGECVHRSMV